MNFVGILLDSLRCSRHFFDQHDRWLDGGLQLLNDPLHVLFRGSEPVPHYFDGLFDRVRHRGDLFL